MKYSNKSATKIMIQIQNGDNSGTEKLYLMCQDKIDIISGKKHRVFTDDWSKEDHCQEIFTTVLEKKNEFDSTRAGFSTWLNFKEQKVYYDHVVKHKMVIGHEDENTGENSKEYIPYKCPLMATNDQNEVYYVTDLSEKYGSVSAEEEALTKIGVADLLEELDSLRDNYKQAVWLCEVQGLKPAQAAEIMGYKPDAFYNIHSRALKKLETIAERECLLDDRYAYDNPERVKDEHYER